MAANAVEARVTGRVQGVGFRAWSVQQARALGLRGWVRNEQDGSVTALVAGNRAAVETMLERLRHGPPAALVECVRTMPVEAIVPEGEFQAIR